MIGVMAIMAILAAVIVPTTLKSIEGAAVRVEIDTLGSLGVQMKLYAKEKGAMPTAAGWTTEIAPYAALNPTDILTNRRRINRLYVVDPTAINQRAMIISSMRSGVPLPSYAQVSGNFTNVWNTSYTDVPTGSGWGSWNANNKEYLAIERVNFRSELQSFSISLKNASAGTVSYQIFYSSGTPLTVRQPLAASATIVPVLRAGDRINLYRDSAGALLDYVVVVSTRGGTFQFNGTTWSAP
jgi:type II secretory pathway pseudopilin PulG